MLILPAIDLKRGLCVRLSQGRRTAATVYGENPVEVARAFAADGAQMLHVVDLDAAFAVADSPNRSVLSEILKAVDLSVQTGGGVRSLADAEKLFDLGVNRIVIGTIAVENPPELERIVNRFGGERIVVGIDARDGEVMTRGWEQGGKITAVELAKQAAKVGIERTVYTDVKRDGMLLGVNLEQTIQLAVESGLKVTASGGVASLDDIAELEKISRSTPNVDSVIIGKALYENRFTLREALAVSARSKAVT